jgi:uncharacterized protein
VTWLAMLFGAALAVVSSPAVGAEIEAPGPSGPLKGAMLGPTGADVSIVLIIPGSGPTDQDGNNPYGIRGSTYRLLAEGLAARGIATVRIDKRGMFASRAAVADPNAVTIGDYATDVHSWVAVIRAKTGARCVWILGHSEGGLVALAAGQQAENICGLLLLSTAGRPLGVILREQLKATPANRPVLDQALEAIDALEAGRHVDVSGMNPALLPLFRPQVQDFLISEMSIDPAKLIASFHKPVLIIQGERDIQVRVIDAERLKAANGAAELVLLPNANHVLKTVTSDDRAANLATYSDPELPLAAGLIDSIEKFLAASKAH